MTKRPPSIWSPSPNFAEGRGGSKITLVVLHATATSGIQSPLEWLQNTASHVSAHYLIGLDGTLHHLVHEYDTAWHAGESVWNGQKYCNRFSIGIELVNANDGLMIYPIAQVKKCAELCSGILKDYGMTIQDIVGHRDVAPGRKTDPAGFQWPLFRELVAV